MLHWARETRRNRPPLSPEAFRRMSSIGREMRKETQDASSRSATPGAEGLGAKLEEYARSMGAELYGVASAEDYAERFPEKPQPTRFVEGASSVVVIGMPFEPRFVRLLRDMHCHLPGRRDALTELKWTSFGPDPRSGRY